MIKHLITLFLVVFHQNLLLNTPSLEKNMP